MSPENQFWWNWSVNVAVAIATLGAVLVALFGDWIKAHLFSPKLNVSLRNTFGDKTKTRLEWFDENGLRQSRMADSRYYHLAVSNGVRWPAATQTQVYLQRVEEPGPDGELQTTWAGEIPMEWMHQSIYPAARTVGPVAYCDLCSVLEDKWLQLHTIIAPNNLEVLRKTKTTLVVSLQAKSSEAESPIARFKISWDGKWEAGDTEMKRHLVVTDVTGK